MADVGVLNLQIHHDSSQAEAGLVRLADALTRVKDAVGSGLKLSGIASQISKIAKVVNENVSESTIIKLGEFGDALSKLKGLENIRINIKGDAASSGIGQMAEEGIESIDSMADGFEQMESRVSTAGEGFKEFSDRVRGAGDIIQNTNWSGGMHEFKQMFEYFSRMQSSRALEAGPQMEVSADVEKGWAEWKEGAIEVEGTVSDAMDNVSGYLSGTQSRLEGTTEALRSTASAADNVARSATNAANSVQAFDRKTSVVSAHDTMKEVADRNAANMQARADNLKKILEMFANSSEKQQEIVAKWFDFDPSEFEKAKAGMNSTIQSMQQMEQVVQKLGDAPQTGSDIVRGLTEGFGKADLMQMKLDGMKQSLAENIDAGKLDTAQVADRAMRIQELSDKIDRMREAEESASASTRGLSGAWDDFKNSIKNTGIGKLITQFGRIAKLRAMRAVIKHISSGFSEGVQNVYQYSKAIGSSFAPSMDSASSSLLQMKNSIGAAAAPAIQALIPLMQTVVNWFITGINYVNQFLSLLRGQQTWTKAIPATASAFDKTKKAASGAGSAIKDLLADWDELNIIQSQTGGSGGGAGTTGAEDYMKMFEQSSKFDKSVRKVTDFVRENLDKIKTIALEIGAIFAAWKVSALFGGTLGSILGLAATGLAIKVVFDAVTMFDNQFLKSKEPGWLVGDMLTTIIGGVLMKKILSKVLGGGLAKIAIPLAFGVSAVASIAASVGNTDVSTLSPENIALDVEAALKGGAAAGILAKTVMGAKLGTAIGGGIAAALMTFGIAIGVKTVARASQSDLTAEDFEAVALSSLSMGLGAAGLAWISGAGLVGAAAFGGAAAIGTGLVLAAAIGIAALLRTEDEPVQWGNYTATEEQIRSFVKGELFTADVDAMINLASSKVEISEGQRKDIENDIASNIGVIETIKLGLATEDTYEQLKQDMFGADGEGGQIGRLKNYAKTQTTLIQTSFSLMPIVGDNGETDATATAESLKKGMTGWSEVESYMNTIGGQLAQALEGGTKDGLKKYDDSVIEVLMEKVTNVQKAMAEAQISSESVSGIMSGLTGLSRESFGDALGMWNTYREGLRTEYESLLQSEYQSYKQLEAFYLARGEEGDAEIAQGYADEAEKLFKTWQERLDKAVGRMEEPGKKIFREAILKMLDFEITSGDLATAVTWTRGFDTSTNLVRAMFDPDGTISSGAKDLMTEYMDNLLESVFPDDYEVLLKMIDAGVLSYLDLIPKEMINGLAEGFLAETNNEEIRAAWNAFIDSFKSDAKRSVDEASAEPAQVAEDVEVVSTVNPSVEVAEGGTTVQDYVEESIEAVEGMDNVAAGTPDYSNYTNSMSDIVQIARESVDGVLRELDRINGLSLSIGVHSGSSSDPSAPSVGDITQRLTHKASGGAVRSGDLVVANENGQFEMMGRMGNQPVVANNQQIVSGIAQGVTSANGDVVSELRTLTTLMQRMLNKEFVARAVPGSGWGRANVQSEQAYNRVTG